MLKSSLNIQIININSTAILPNESEIIKGIIDEIKQINEGNKKNYLEFRYVPAIYYFDRHFI